MILGLPLRLIAAAIVRVEAWQRRQMCQAFGHQFSWTYGAMVGSTRPVCEFCKQELAP